ncbi:hypothetical protein KQI10_10735 [Pseudoflavonifractor sp. MSJ-30]|uniref:hypothetical protein n=1 Tax=Pseudoflavonifractor sp. MSJ-30 TaxID=2841525 RepID=UPI001C0F56ED|nr:hypothetical protein [Pseudoflavonifractor sp. MSJ-30]MBU5453642.1 hypothetical protein [Pseudoflavonifractor sp. MSJ-30]
MMCFGRRGGKNSALPAFFRDFLEHMGEASGAEEDAFSGGGRTVVQHVIFYNLENKNLAHFYNLQIQIL